MKKGPLCVMSSYICWGLLGVFWKSLGPADALYVLAARICFSQLMLVILLTVRRGWPEVREMLHDGKEWLWLTAAGVLICMNWGVYIWAVKSGHMIDSSLAYYMSPLLSLLLAALIYRERFSGLQWLSAGIILAGLVVTMVRFGHFPWIAVVIGGTFTLYSGVKKHARCAPIVSMFMETAVLTPFALTFMAMMESRGTGALGILSGWQLVLLCMTGVVTTIPLLLFAEGIKTTPMSLSGILMYINPTLMLLLGIAFYHEVFTANHAILFAFVWTGLALFLIAGARERKKERTKENAPCV